MTATMSEEARKQAILEEAAPIINARVGSAEEAQLVFNEEVKIAPTLGSWDVYFGPHSSLDPNNHAHRVLVDWYLMSVETLNGINGDYVVYEDEAPLYINFRQSYIQYCRAHKIAPDQDQSWNAIYAAISAKGIQGFPTLSTFMLKQSTANAEVRNDS
jgi:hypothetical protein